MISVIVPAFNRPARLFAALCSILNQTFQKFEIIVVDDSSDKRVYNVISKLSDNRIKYIKNKVRLGVVNSRVVGINRSCGDFIAFLDDDDLWNNNKLELQYNVIKKNDTIGMVLSNYTINNLVTNHHNYVSIKHFSTDFIKQILFSPGPFLQCALIKKKYLSQSHLLFDSKAIPSEDWDFFITLSKQKILVAHIDTSLFVWNFSQESQSSHLINETNALEYIINKHRDYIKNTTTKANLGAHYRKLAHMFVKINNKNKSYQYYRRAFTCNFLSIKNALFLISYVFFGARFIKFYFFKKNKMMKFYE